MADRWLKPEEQRVWFALLAVTTSVHSALDREMQRQAGMPHAYYGLLAMLSSAPGHACRVTELAGLTDSSQSRISHAVTRLETLGWLRREQDPSDGRGTLVVLTDAGLAALASAAPGHVAQVRALVFDKLSPVQLRQLDAITRTLLAGLRPNAPNFGVPPPGTGRAHLMRRERR